MSVQSRKSRGMRTQTLVAEWFRACGFPYATDAGAGRPGKDILNTPGLSIEVKARSKFEPQAWLRQAAGAAVDGELPMVVFRPNGMGPESIDRWGVLLTLGDLDVLLNKAGFGTEKV